MPRGEIHDGLADGPPWSQWVPATRQRLKLTGIGGALRDRWFDIASDAEKWLSADAAPAAIRCIGVYQMV